MNLADLPAIAAEDQARANHYALLARLFGAPPDAALFALLADSARTLGKGDGALARAWSELGGLAASLAPDAVGEEYLRLFIGTGRPEIFLYGSYYLAGFLMEEPLADLRDALAALGLARRLGVGEPEDHITALTEVMRHLIVAGADLGRQNAFYARHLEPWVRRLADALEAAPAQFYPGAGRFARAFFDIEGAAFAMA